MCWHLSVSGRPKCRFAHQSADEGEYFIISEKQNTYQDGPRLAGIAQKSSCGRLIEMKYLFDYILPVALLFWYIEWGFEYIILFSSMSQFGQCPDTSAALPPPAIVLQPCQ